MQDDDVIEAWAKLDKPTGPRPSAVDWCAAATRARDTDRMVRPELVALVRAAELRRKTAAVVRACQSEELAGALDELRVAERAEDAALDAFRAALRATTGVGRG